MGSVGVVTAANDNVTRPSARPEQARPCPICGRPAAAEMRPFCSKRCADVDLHRWLGGRYALPAEPDDAPADDPET